MACGGKVKKYADGGDVDSAFVGTKLNLPVKTRLGKVSSSDARLLNKQDASPEGQRAKFERRNAIPSSATTEERYGTTPENAELQYIKRGGRIAKKVGKVKKYAAGGSVASKLQEGINSGKDLDPGIMSDQKSRIVMRNSAGDKVEVKPVPMPRLNQNDEINIPGVGRGKLAPIQPRGNLQPLKKGGKVKLGKVAKKK